MDDEMLTMRALSAYYKVARREGYSAAIPANRSGVESANGKDYVVLFNGLHNILAVYRIRNDGMLKRLHRWPANLGTTEDGGCRDEWRLA